MKIAYLLFQYHYQFDHCIPFSNQFGGTYITTTEESYNFLKNLNLSVELIMANSGYQHLSGIHVNQIISFLSKEKFDLVIFTDILPEFSETTLLQKIEIPTFFVSHGFSDKDYYCPFRKEVMNDFNYILSYGPIFTDYLENHVGVKTNIIKYGLPRLVDLNKKIQEEEQKISIKNTILQKYNLKEKTIILYAPTWFTYFTSVKDIGEKIIKNIDKNKYVILFRPHPLTPEEYLEKFIALYDENFILVANEDLIDLILISDILIGDDSSLNYDFLVTKKPIIYTWSKRYPKWKISRSKLMMSKSLKKEYWKSVPKISRWNVSKVNKIIENALKPTKNEQKMVSAFIKNCYYNYDKINYSDLKQIIFKMRKK